MRKKVTLEVYVGAVACARCGREEPYVPRVLEVAGPFFRTAGLPDGVLVATGFCDPPGWESVWIPGEPSGKVCPACAPGVRSALLLALDRLAESDA